MDKTPSYTLSYRNVKHARLEYKTGTLLLILPKDSEDEEQILEKYKKWILKKERIIKKALEEAQAKNLNFNRTEKELRNLIHLLVRDYQMRLNTKINKIYFRRMRTKWASHSRNRNLTINTLLRYLPQNTIEYITYHEIAHSIERKHNERFWNIITKKFPDYQTKEKDLLTYWFTIQIKWPASVPDTLTTKEIRSKTLTFPS